MEIFLSHATADTTIVDAIRSRLSPLGVAVYATEHDGQAGVNVHAKIQAAIRRCDLMTVLLTSRGNNSHYVHQEIGYAKRDKKLIIPLVTADVASGGIGMLEGIEYIVVDDTDPTDALHLLSKRIESIKIRQADQDALVMAGLILVAIGIMLIAMNE
jgi:hypothetical protein